MKKGKIIFIAVIAVVICAVVPLILNRGKIQRKLEAIRQEETERIKYEEMLKSDEIAPVLILTQDKITMYQGDELNYKSFIKEASDNLEGDLTEKVKYQEIDVNKVGEYTIEYEISDTASNTTKAELQVIIKEKPNFKY
ncbi:MAG: DUF5011 domain-containing protein [Bacilli bacterium]|nr:DUF5011 domain-containing protein [Bacilli bacterium]